MPIKLCCPCPPWLEYGSSDQQISVYNQQQQRRPFNGGNRTTTRLPRDIWMKLDETSRNIIRGIDPSNPPSSASRQVNVHDFVQVDYAENPPDVKQDEDGQIVPCLRHDVF